MKSNLEDYYYRCDSEGLALMDKGDGPKVTKALNSVNGWRGLFDSYCCEYKGINIHNKWKTIEILKEFFNCEFDGLVYLFIKDCLTNNNKYRINGVATAILEYSEYYPEVEDYLLKLYFKINLKTKYFHFKNWKSEIANELFAINSINLKGLKKLLFKKYF